MLFLLARSSESDSPLVAAIRSAPAVASMTLVAHARSARRSSGQSASRSMRGSAPRTTIAALRILLRRPHVALAHVHALDHHPVLARQHPQHGAFRPAKLPRITVTRSPRRHVTLPTLTRFSCRRPAPIDLRVPSDHLRRERDDLHEALLAQLAATGPKMRVARGSPCVVDDHGGVLVEADVRCRPCDASPSRCARRPPCDVALLHRAVRQRVLDGDDDHVAQPGVAPARAAQHADARARAWRPSCPRSRTMVSC